MVKLKYSEELYRQIKTKYNLTTEFVQDYLNEYGSDKFYEYIEELARKETRKDKMISILR